MDNSLAGLAQQIGISRLANLTGLDRVGYPVVAAIRPLSRNLSVSFGKGDTPEQARLSAIMEAAELHYSETPPQWLTHAAFRDLPLHSTLDPRLLEPIETEKDICAQPLYWLSGHDLLNDQDILVPWQTASMDFSLEARKQERILQFGATGLAAAFNEEQAVLHGLCEVIERDAHDKWNQSDDDSKMTTLVNLETIEHPRIRVLLEQITSAQLSLLLWDMTGDAAVPCYLAEVVDLAADANTAFAQGAAADFYPDVAICKAISEALQVRLTYIAGSRDDLDWSDYGNRYGATVENRRWLLKQGLANRHVAMVPAPVQSVRDQCDTIIRRMAQAGKRHVVVVHLSPDDLPVVVVKVLVPNMRDIPDADHFAPETTAEPVTSPC